MTVPIGVSKRGTEELWMWYHTHSKIAQEAIEKNDPRLENPMRQLRMIVEELAVRGLMATEMPEADVQLLQWRHFMLMQVIENVDDCPREVNEQCREVALELRDRGHPVEARRISMKSIKLTGRAPATGAAEMPQQEGVIEYFIDDFDDPDETTINVGA